MNNNTKRSILEKFQEFEGYSIKVSLNVELLYIIA